MHAYNHLLQQEFTPGAFTLKLHVENKSQVKPGSAIEKNTESWLLTEKGQIWSFRKAVNLLLQQNVKEI